MIDNPSTSSGQFQKAFSLIEIVIVVAITSVLLIVTMQILSSAIRIESRTLVAQAMYEQVNYLIDYISKDIRMAARGSITGDCNRGIKQKIGIIQENGGIAIKDQRNNCMEYSLAIEPANGTQEEEKYIIAKRTDYNNLDPDNPYPNAPYVLPLTSKDFKVTDLNFSVLPQTTDSADGAQTKVLISLGIESKKYKDIKLKIQTLVSTRNRD
ncbi:prepilin-type N-terminal cleavage/methylation domain-containing protein [Candidatus Parcubacteria bacterium]|nr:prepilin-type N-terminal cleavage/methylation domain-containing protein [Candidatus Parcubacteria bacterium]